MGEKRRVVFVAAKRESSPSQWICRYEEGEEVISTYGHAADAVNEMIDLLAERAGCESSDIVAEVQVNPVNVDDWLKAQESNQGAVMGGVIPLKS